MILEPKLKGHFLNLYHMALSDSQIDTTELEMLYKIGEQRGVSKAEIDATILEPDNVKFTVPDTVLEKIECLYDFAMIAWADGQIDSSERRLIEMFCKKFGFQDDNIPTITQFLLDEVENGTTKEKVLLTVSENL
jgi:uncharacterized tellurite resistance protein B-like protein